MFKCATHDDQMTSPFFKKSSGKDRIKNSHREYRYYFFGLRAGFLNLFNNHFALGFKKTIGKIAQPINSVVRFPEYYHFEALLVPRLIKKAKVLDVGSPKLFGLYLAEHYPIKLFSTDLNSKDIEEYSTFSKGLGCASEKLRLEQQDARCLKYPDNTFDAVYSMSVVEHVEGEDGDGRAIDEMMRVLKPGGLLVVSVPFGNRYIKQNRDGKFFQRIYDSDALEDRLLAGREVPFAVTSLRRRIGLFRLYCRLSESGRGLLGFLNPLLSLFVNCSVSGVHDGPSSYQKNYHRTDFYNDIIFRLKKS
jgi:SAM-dependent methyltransferase